MAEILVYDGDILSILRAGFWKHPSSHDSEFSLNTDDRELVRQQLAGNDDGFQMLVQRYLKQIYNFVRVSISDPQAAEDLTQEVFIKAWAHLKRFDSTKSFKVWIHAIARNTVFDFLRKKKSIPFSSLASEEEIYEVSDLEPLPDELLQTKNAAEILHAALSKIPPVYREVLVLHYQNDFSISEIAEISKTSLNTIKSRHRRAISMLKKILKEKDFG